MEADLRSEYGVRLVDFYMGKLSLRELIVLAIELPRSSRVHQYLLNEDPAQWDLQEYMMADITNACRVMVYMWQMHFWSKAEKNRGPSPEMPELIKEPGWTKEKPKMSTTAELKEFFGL